MSLESLNGASRPYTAEQRAALAVASVRLKLIRKFGSRSSTEIAQALVDAAKANVPISDIVDLLDLAFPNEKIPAATVGAAYRLAREVAQPESGGRNE